MMSEREKGWQAYFSQPRLMAILDDPLLLPRAKNGGFQLVYTKCVARKRAGNHSRFVKQSKYGYTAMAPSKKTPGRTTMVPSKNIPGRARVGVILKKVYIANIFLRTTRNIQIFTKLEKKIFKERIFHNGGGTSTDSAKPH